MEIGPLVTRAVLTVKPGDRLRDAAVAMMERGVGSAVVITDGKPSGILTDRETLRAIAQGKDAGRLTVGDFMVGRPTTVSASLELLDAARIMREKGFRHLVVVDENGALAGVFSMRDLVVGLLEERKALARAAAAVPTGPPSDAV
ncbi:MAG: CBS domain-containing protein [Actinomycetota bacterium]|nr:CBS domain-containing protein [Actinomycetota bacterium]